MSSLSRFPRLALACLFAALAAGGLLLLLEATDQPAAAGPAPSAPTRFPPAGRDCLDALVPHMMVNLGQGPFPIVLSGTSSISRTAPYIDPGSLIETVETEMVALNLQGYLPDGMPVTLTLQSALPSFGIITSQSPTQTFPADSFFDVFVEIETPGGVYVNSSRDPLILHAVIDSIPPISATYQSQGPVPLQGPPGQEPPSILEFVLHPVRERECWFWKAGGWIDYAPNGVPDFDQKQDGFQVGPPWTYCGPVAAANSLWWLDSKLEPYPAPPTEDSDHFPLVKSYTPGAVPWDDHWISNTVPLAQELAELFETGRAGTEVGRMYQGMLQYLIDRGLAEDFTVGLVARPPFEEVTDEVMRSEDVILLLGFWQCVEPSGEECFLWVRLGGHYVTVAGVDPIGRFIAFSDPFFDRAEVGGAGRVLSGTLISHTFPFIPHPSFVHNDAGNVSHDMYRAIETESPGGEWGLADYAKSVEHIANFLGQNFPEGWDPGGPVQGDVIVEVEFMLATSPLPPQPWVIKVTEETDVRWNELITYTITYGNDGGITGFDARVVDYLPAGVTYVNSTPGGVHAGGVVTWTFPTLAPHSSTPLTVTALVSMGLPIGEPLTNTVYLYLGTTVWDWDDATSHVTGAQLFVPSVLRNAPGG